MIKSVNQIRLELAEIQANHKQLNSFFWGDFLRAYKENRLNYPLMGAFYPTSTLLRNQTQLQLRIYIADKLYKDWSNLNDIESDTLQTCRDIYNTMNNSTRWQTIGRVQSCSVTKFINRGGDEVAGHEMTMNFLIRDRDGVCGLPMGSYDFDQVTGSLCSPVQIYEDGILIDTIPSGGIYNVVGSPATQVIEDSLGNQLYSNSIPSGATETQVIQDSTYTVEYINGTLIESGSILAEGSVVVQVPNPIVCADATVNVNGSIFDTVASGGTSNVPVVNEGTNPAGTITGGEVVIANSDVFINTIQVGDIPAEDNLSIAVTLDGTPSGTWNAGTQTWEVVGVPSTPRSTATLMKTGATTSYAAEDDFATSSQGRATDFLTLDSAPLHNDGSPTLNTTTNRLTDTLGGQTYTDTIVLDWSTWNGSTLVGYRKTLSTTNQTWEYARVACIALTIGGFSDWRVTNMDELGNICNTGQFTTSVLEYAPFSIVADLNVWSSTTYPKNTNNAYFLGSTGAGVIGNLSKAVAACRFLPIRTYTLSTSNVLS